VFFGFAALTANADPVVIGGPIVNPANNNTYLLLSPDTWLASEAAAVALGGHLVTINNAAEDQWVFSTFSPLALNYASANNLSGGISLWIGLSDFATEGVYVWSSGEPVTYTNWSPFQPQNGQPDEDFAGIFVNFGEVGQWHDIVGDFRFGDVPFGVVEVTGQGTAPIPEPTTMLLLGTGLAGVATKVRKRRKAQKGEES
jgi:hypothetical protein